MPNELAIKLSFINDMIEMIMDNYELTPDTYTKIIAASNSIYEAEQSITSMVN